MPSLLLKLKIWLLEADLRRMVLAEGVQPKVWSFGAYYIDPKHLVFIVGVNTDEEKVRLKANASLAERMRRLLAKRGWPEAAQRDVAFEIESQESVTRESAGNWWHHYK